MSNVMKQEQPVSAAPPSPPVQKYATWQPQKPPRRRFWMLLGIIGGVLLLAGIALAVSLNFLTTTVVKPLVGPTIVADQYYTAIKNQDYTKAYSY